MGSSEIDAYIATFPEEVQAILESVRAAVLRAAPEAEEVFSYRMPAFKQGNILVYFAAWKNHIGLYPPVTGNEALMKAVARYAGPKGNLQFPIDKPMPLALIQRIVKHRLKQIEQKKAAKRKRK